MSARLRGGRLDDMEYNDIPAGTTPAGTTPPALHRTSGGRPIDAPRPPAATSRFTLRRSRTDRMLGGVCGGLAESLGADAALLRVLLVASR